mgnify:CR=1 FL=1
MLIGLKLSYFRIVSEIKSMKDSNRKDRFFYYRNNAIRCENLYSNSFHYMMGTERGMNYMNARLPQWLISSNRRLAE